MDAQEASQTVVLHSRVLVELVDTAGEVEERTFTLVSARQADFRSGLLDENTPLGLALLGKRAGEVIPYALGDLREVRVLAVESGAQDVSAEAAQKRRAAVRKAEAQSEITSQMIFASASGSKWGDYEVNVDKLLDSGDEGEQSPPAAPDDD